MTRGESSPFVVFGIRPNREGITNVETINGFTVMASAHVGNGERIILGARAYGRNGGSAREYVTARTLPESAHPTTWNAGYYTLDLDSAVRSFHERSGHCPDCIGYPCECGTAGNGC